MNSKQIELLGINIIETFLMKSPRLMPYFDKNDKTDSWDGFIFVYNESKQKKSSLIGRIPVQIKSTKKKINSAKSSFPLEIADINNYKKEGGVIVFYVSTSSKTVYSSTLLPYDLKKIISEKRHNQKTKSISLKRVNKSNILDFECICKEFFFHKEKQFSLPFTENTPKEFNEILMHNVVPKKTDIGKYLFNREQYLYLKTGPNSLIFDNVSKVNIVGIRSVIDKQIYINGKKYYDNYKVIQLKNGYAFQFGENVQINLTSKKLKFTFTPEVSIYDRLNDTNFILSYLKYKKIYNSDEISLFSQPEFNAEEFNNIINYNNLLSKIIHLFEFLKLNCSILNLDELSDNDIKNLEQLYETFIEKKDYPDENLKQGLLKMTIANIKIALIGVPGKNKVILQDINSLAVGQIFLVPQDTTNSKSLKETFISVYQFFKCNDFIEFTNILPELALKDIKQYDHSIIMDSRTIELVLELIKAYDKIRNISYIDSAESILLWLKSGPVDDKIININLLQIKRRKRELKINEIEQLKHMYDDNPNDLTLRICINILLEDKHKFKRNYKRLSQEEKDIFSQYPIYTLREFLHLT